ncbi:MAG: ParA family protein [Acidobacteriota bacterium]
MEIIAIGNKKGGVGKTTTAVNLAGALAKLEKSVLLIDLDSQACASTWLTGSQASVGTGIYEVLVNKADVTSQIVKTPFGIDVVKADITMTKLDRDLQETVNRDHRLARALAQIQDKYDYVIIDCPPSLALASINAFVAATKIIVPVDCRIEAFEATSRVLDTCQEISEELGVQFKIYALPTFFKRTRIAQQVVKALQEKFSGMVLPEIRENTRLPESFGTREPIFTYDHTASGAVDYTEVAKNVA